MNVCSNVTALLWLINNVAEFDKAPETVYFAIAFTAVSTMIKVKTRRNEWGDDVHDYFASQLVYYPVIMTIFCECKRRKAKMRNCNDIIVIFCYWYYIISYYRGRILILFLLSYLNRKDLPLSLHMFNGSFPWVIDSIIIRTISLFVLFHYSD